MSDNITQITELNTQETPQRTTFAKKAVVLVVTAVAVCFFVALFLFNDALNFDTVLRWGKYFASGADEDFGSYSFDFHSSNCYAGFDDGLAVASIGGLNVYDESGTEIQVLQRQLELPRMLVNDEMALAYDVGGNALIALHEKRGEVLSLEQTYPILDADLSEKGAVCISSSASGYKSVLSVYNEGQELIYRWLSSSTYFPLCAVSPDADALAAVAVGQSEGTFESRICLFNTDAEDIQCEISLGNELIYDLVYLREDLLCAVGESSVQVVSTSGEVIGKYEYKDDYLKDFDFGGDGFLTLSTNMYRAGNRFTLVTLNEKGRELDTLAIGKEVLDISACGRYIAVLTPGKVTVYNQSLSVYYEVSDAADITSVVMREDGTVLLIGGGKGKLYIP